MNPFNLSLVCIYLQCFDPGYCWRSSWIFTECACDAIKFSQLHSSVIPSAGDDAYAGKEGDEEPRYDDQVDEDQIDDSKLKHYLVESI